MSLRAFHVVFVLASILLSAGLAYWGLGVHRSGGGTGGLWLAAGAAALALVLCVYLPRFLAKTKGLGR